MTSADDDATDAIARARVGTVIDDKWTLDHLLGIGGMAAVYAAQHRNGARAAVKILHPDLSRLKDVRERFRREGYAANRVDHPGVVRVLDDDVVAEGPGAGTAYIVMELLEGESLQDRIDHDPPVSELEFLRIAESVLDVLEAAHANGVVHRDLKPENLFLQRDDGTAGSKRARVKVLDFGLARLLQGQAITTYGLALGTPSFMSPEQAAGRLDEIDGRTDLFALGATGLRARTGRRIHEAPNAILLVRKMANSAAPRIRELDPEVSEPFARVIDRALEFRRDDRYENAAAMRDDVVRASQELDPATAATHLALPSLAPSRRPPPTSAAPPIVAPSVPPPPPLSAPPSRRAQPPARAERDEPPPSSRRADSPPSPPPAKGGASARAEEKTIELSSRDLEPVVRAAAKRRKRSFLPWLALFFFVGIGVKLWLDSRDTGAEADAAPDDDLRGASTATDHPDGSSPGELAGHRSTAPRPLPVLPSGSNAPKHVPPPHHSAPPASTPSAP